MRISIVTVVFNDLLGLKRTANSVISQDNCDYEWVVCDGGTGDELCQYLASLPGIACWVSEPDDGIYDAMNKGVSLCQGDYVVFLNAGDVFSSSNTLSLVIDKLEAKNSCTDPVDVLFGGAFLELPSGDSVFRGVRKMEDYIWHGLPANHQATYYRREVLLENSYDLRYKVCGDYYIAAQLYKVGASVAYLEAPLVRFQVGGASYTNRQLLLLEPYIIQRDVLKQSLTIRIRSIIKRSIATIIMTAITQRWFPTIIFRRLSK